MQKSNTRFIKPATEYTHSAYPSLIERNRLESAPERIMMKLVSVISPSNDASMS